jgi:hypothetical protein
MARSVFAAALALGLCAGELHAQDRKTADALRVEDGTIRVDGVLDEEIWGRTAAITDFVQKEPTEGAAPTDAMEVRFVYDDRAFYVGARMYSRVDTRIQAPLGRRDTSGQAEHILVALDTFLDRRTSVVFGVTAAGVRLDRLHTTDNEDSSDSGFDPVWDAQVSVTPDGWTAELWIPFTQLRFNPQSDLVWGLNVQRLRPTLNEEDTWILIPRTVRAWSSRFGDLRGIEDVPKTRRVEFLPYVAAEATLNANRDRANPFDDGTNLNGRVGADLKVGLGPNLTLDAAFNPDFGQVEADPAEVNLTAFETRFPERRPFFLEGASLFNIGHPNFYYSRRIGARPIGPASDTYVHYPSATTILAAAKVTGRLPSKTSIGLLSAATAEEHAELAGPGGATLRSLRVAPRAYYGYGRVLQEFGELASTAGFIASYVHRDVDQGDPLADLLTRNAFGLAGNTTLRFKGGEYELRAAGGGSYVGGEEKAIERVQRSSAHYAQRPDRDYSPLDPTLRSLGGWTMQANFDRTSGRHWLFGTSTKIDSVNFEANDFAQLNAGDGSTINGNIRYRETQPGRVFRNYTIRLEASNDSTLRWLRQAGHVRGQASATWANFWTSSFSVTRNLEQVSVSLTRGGPLMGRGPGWTMQMEAGNRSSAETRVSAEATIARNDDGYSQNRVEGSLSFRPGPRWQISAEPYYDRVTEPQQYVQAMSGGRPETYDTRYIFAFIRRATVATRFRLGLTVRPDMNIDLYAEPFAASGHYYDYGELLAPRSRERLLYGTSGTTLVINPDGSQTVTADGSTFTLRNRDFNSLSFRSNVVLRWEWRAGSTLYLVWQQNRANSETSDALVNAWDQFRSITAPGSNYFIVKSSFWIPFW